MITFATSLHYIGLQVNRKINSNLESAEQNNPFLVVVLGDFNAKPSKERKSDTTTTEGKAIENISSQFGLHQVINEPTHILESSSSCIDLIFTSKPNLIT